MSKPVSANRVPDSVKRGDAITAARWNALQESVYAINQGQQRARRKWFTGINATGSTIPELGVATLGSASASPTEPVVNLEQAGDGLAVVVATETTNGNQCGVHIIDSWHPTLVKCSDATVVAGDTIGPVASSFEVGKTGSGLIAVTDYDSGFVWAASAGGGGGGNFVAKTTTQIPARSTDTPGGPTTVTKQRITGGVFVDDGTIDIYSWVNSPSKDPADMTDPAGELYIFVEEGLDGNHYWTGEDCTPAEPATTEDGTGSYTILDEDNFAILTG